MRVDKTNESVIVLSPLVHPQNTLGKFLVNLQSFSKVVGHLWFLDHQWIYANKCPLKIILDITWVNVNINLVNLTRNVVIFDQDT